MFYKKSVLLKIKQTDKEMTASTRTKTKESLDKKTHTNKEICHFLSFVIFLNSISNFKQSN